jgi:uncharacterized protein (DUF305 family)
MYGTPVARPASPAGVPAARGSRFRVFTAAALIVIREATPIMPNRPRSFALLAVAVAFTLGACSAGQPTEPSGPDAVRSDPTAPEQAGPAPEPATAHAEIHYMLLTMHHHAGGAGMAQLCVHKATHHDLRALCQRAVEVQTHEIHALQTWLHDWYGVNHTPHVVPDDERHIEHLAARNGAEFEIELMEALGARGSHLIEASRHLLEQVHHAHLRDLAASIIQHQSHDIAEMRSWLCHWYACEHAG